MSDEVQEMGKWIQEWVTRAVREQVQTTQRYGELLQRVARGEVDSKTLRAESARFAREETARFARSLATLSISYFNTLLELSRTHNEHFIEQVLGAATQSDKAKAEPATRHRVAVELRAPLAQEATGAFVIENRRTAPVEISFLVSEFSAAGAAPFRPPLRIEPPRLMLDPGEEQIVTLKLPLLPELFELKKPYTARIAVSGGEDMEVLLTVWAEASPKQKRARRKPSGASQASPKRTTTKPKTHRQGSQA
jgi:hypothetical protein